MTPTTTTTPPHAEAPRVAAWLALSDLFLDTELDDGDIAAIARQLRGTGFDVATLERIYESEVAPVCWKNLAVVPGGVWTGFSREWLVDAIGKHLASPRSVRAWSPDGWLGQMRIARATAMSRPDWQRVRAALAGGDDDARRER